MIRHPTDCQYDLAIGIGPTLSRLEISSTMFATDNGGAVIFYQKKKSKTTKIFTKEVKFYAIIYYLAKPWFALEVVGVQTGAH